MSRLKFSGSLLAMALPAMAAFAAPAGIYTAAQAKAGQLAYTQSCESCHGSALQGISGPKLIGQDFAKASDHYTLGLVFTNLWEGTPAGAPDSLSHATYVNIMAYLLAKNGYPSGTVALNFNEADQSRAAFVSLVK